MEALPSGLVQTKRASPTPVPDHGCSAIWARAERAARLRPEESRLALLARIGCRYAPPERTVSAAAAAASAAAAANATARARRGSRARPIATAPPASSPARAGSGFGCAVAGNE